MRILSSAKWIESAQVEHVISLVLVLHHGLTRSKIRLPRLWPDVVVHKYYDETNLRRLCDSFW